ncbi:MAG: glycosyltransferase family 2 protein [Rickettsiales bacterium]|nr:glycosyltransferase family 2 protein [Rickettsiales bacterium]
MIHFDVSYVITVYNKQKFISELINNLKAQNTILKKEYIFVDDASTDASVERLKSETEKLQNVTIIQNKKNYGPSIRLNQGAAKAKGEYLYLLDADELIPNNATEVLISLLRKHDADFIYGKKLKTGQEIEKINTTLLPSTKLSYKILCNPLNDVLSEKYVGMGLIVKRDIFNKANGCDEHVFIQDESLPLKLAYVAKKFISLNHITVFAPKIEGLSTNKNQQHYDRFMAYRNALITFKYISKESKLKLYKRAVSSAWKTQKKDENLIYKIRMFVLYTYTKYFTKKISTKHLDHLNHYMNKLLSVRKMDTKTLL